ncbi:hypothetical protein IEO21_04653 [Rhodonia placenta]|uniref:Cerato-platanin n=2 Tax=Rhodonia placenta TaxID=104341 RepID=A0A1X6N9D1_9APHY|nr:hypothetical protein POSPLADRAFT_1065158 [Postia placenta MAD-698-R-SB12]KAF9815290.1 hypothetical protein IEO21_04653 [Postia placenta]OSX65255.1 hypothetical protein POSPLADRAFT_1065158 [Postia placenta MAD-698-R-SB12]
MVRAQATVPVSYDTVYDNCSASLSTVACSSQLESLGYDTFGSLPDFPFIGGAAVVTPYGSGECGSCWELSYQGNRITVLAIDYTDQGFNIAEEAFDVLTNGQAQSLGRLEAVATQVNISACGL